MAGRELIPARTPLTASGDSMRVLGVIDLLGGDVVRGIGGQRETYRPIVSPLCADSKPATVAQAYRRLGLTEIYVADLDAIAGREPAWDIYDELVNLGCRLTIDAGLRDADRAHRLAVFSDGQTDVVAALECLPEITVLGDILQVVPAERLLFSLDLKAGEPIVGGPAWARMSPEGIAEMAIALGITRMIVLDLACVGVDQGVETTELCRSLRKRHPRVEFISGGGVRGLDDLRSLSDAGCKGALVASALHDGRLSKSDIALAADLRTINN